MIDYASETSTNEKQRTNQRHLFRKRVSLTSIILRVLFQPQPGPFSRGAKREDPGKEVGVFPFASSSDWLIALFMSIAVSQSYCNYFGFGFTIFNNKLL